MHPRGPGVRGPHGRRRGGQRPHPAGGLRLAGARGHHDLLRRGHAAEHAALPALEMVHCRLRGGRHRGDDAEHQLGAAAQGAGQRLKAPRERRHGARARRQRILLLPIPYALPNSAPS